MRKLLFSEIKNNTIEKFNTSGVTTSSNPGFTVDGSKITIHNDDGMSNFNKDNYNDGPYSIHIGNEVTFIPEGKFSSFQINGLTFENDSKLISIGKFAFYNYNSNNLSSIVNLQIPKTVETIGESAFDNVKITNYSEHSLFVDGSLSSIGKSAFYNNKVGHLSSIVNLQIPSTVKTIGSNAFGYIKITNNIGHPLFVNGDLKSIDSYAFYNKNVDNSYLSSIVNLQIPKTVETIGNSAFDSVKITNNREHPLFVDGGLKRIGSYAFNNKNVDNSYLSTIVNLQIPKTVETIGMYAFGYVKITNDSEHPLFAEGSLESIGNYAFYNNNSNNSYLSSIVNLQIPISVIYIGLNAFESVGYCYTNLGNEKYGALYKQSLCPQTTTAQTTTAQTTTDQSTNKVKSKNTLLILTIIILLLLAGIGGVIYFKKLKSM
jgi:hypothetical protein